MRFLLSTIACVFLLVIVDAEVAVLTPHDQATSQDQTGANQQSNHQTDENGIFGEWVLYSGIAWPFRKLSSVDWTSEAVTAAATVVLAALTLILAFTSLFMWLATRKLVLGAEATAAREHRAYVYLQMGSRPWPTPPAPPNRYSIVLNVRNSGKTWARNVRLRRAVIENPISDPFETGDWRIVDAAPMVLGPGEEVPLQFGDIPFTHLNIVAMGDTEIFYVAWVTYEDTVSEPPIARQTQLYRRLNADTEGGISFTWMPTHNCADEDCP